MSIDEKISISPKTGNFSQKDVSDGVINKQKQKATVKRGVTNDLKDQDEDHIFLFINMHEENPCLWDMLHRDYTKRNEKEIINSSLTDVLETETNQLRHKNQWTESPARI